MERRNIKFEVTDQQREELEAIVAATTSEQRLVRRSKIILLVASGLSHFEVAQKTYTSRQTVSLWVGKFSKSGVAGLQDSPGRGRKPSIPTEKAFKVITNATKPPPDRTRWSVRSMAKAAGMSPASVQRIWSSNSIKPHLINTFKLSKDPQFEQKFWDVVGLYLDPPDRALVLCCDEKSQCQALERTQPGLPLGIGHIRTQTHDYTRHGTITLFAALNYADGKVFSATAEKHTHVEWLAFLKKLHRTTPKDLKLHIIADNYATHKHPVVKEWIANHPRIVMHFTPTSASWMNMVERFFRQITDNVIREGSFSSVAQLVEKINIHLAHHNLSPKPFRWNADGAEILQKIQRAREAMAKPKT
jgi:transposase